MIVPPRWITLKDVRQRLLRHVVESGNGHEENADPETIANKLTWNFCDKAKAVYLHERGDRAVEYPKDYVKPPEGGKHLQANELVDLCIGVPGSGTKKFVTVGEGPKIYAVSGPYVGSPIIFKRTEFNGFLSKLAGPVTKSPLGSEAGIKEYLLETHKAGTYTNKLEVWEYVKAFTSSNKFKKAFQAAKKEDPTFGKVGRPPAK